MTGIVRIITDQSVTLADFQALAQDPRDLTDLVTRVTIDPGMAYSGGAVSRQSATTVRVARPLTVIRDGGTYVADAVGAFDLDMLAALPTAGLRRWVAIVAVVQEIEDATEPRDFVIDRTAQSYVFEARATSTRFTRQVLVQTVAGTSAADPIKPVVDPAALVIGWALLSSAEIVSVEAETFNRLTTLRAVADRMGAVDAFLADAEPRLAGLSADVATLTAGAADGGSTSALMDYLLTTVSRLAAQVGLAGADGYTRSDVFKDASLSDPTVVGYQAAIDAGLGFSDANMADVTPALLNPADSAFVVHGNGLLLPAYVSKRVTGNWGKDAEAPLSNSGASTVHLVQKFASRTRLRYGWDFQPGYWWSGRWYDPYLGYWSAPAASSPWFWKYDRYCWNETYLEPYWDAVSEEVAFTGNVGAQTFTAARTGWLTEIKLGLSRLDVAGDLTVAVTEVTESGTPAYDRTVARVTVARADLALYPAKTGVPIGPLYIEAGKRYAIVLVTPGNHWIAQTQSNGYAGGTFFVSTDGVWAQGDLSKDMAFELWYAEFGATRCSVPLALWGLDGGMSAIELTTEEIVPDATRITWEVQPQVAPLGPWIAIEGKAAGEPFAGTPAGMLARMILQGTKALMPGIWLSRSKVRLRRARTTLLHASPVWHPAAAVTGAKVIAEVDGFDEADHDLDCVLKSTVGGVETSIAAASVSTETRADGLVVRTWKFAFPASTSLRRVLTGLTAGATSTFRVKSVTDIATV